MNLNSSPIDLYDHVLDMKHTPVRYAIMKHRQGKRKPVSMHSSKSNVVI